VVTAASERCPAPRRPIRIMSGRYVETLSAPWRTALLAPAFAIVLVLGICPLATALWTSLSSPHGPTLARYAAFLADPESYAALEATLSVSAAATFLSVLISLPLAYAMRASGRLRNALRVLLATPLAVPVLIAAYALTIFYAEHGLFNVLLVNVLHVASEPLAISYRWPGLVLACVWRFFPYTALVVASALEGLDPALEEAAYSTGARPRQVLFRVVVPLLLPAVFTGSMLTFIGVFGTFSIPLVMGGRQQLLAVIAYRDLTGRFDFGSAATVVTVMAAIQLTLLGLYRRFLRVA
jgi:ABC-type spermidine/putrescine transport system permease subunit I